ncbi:MAG: hypothetical protein K2X77_27160 [Candidatus Obscuribacterales bacterium]|nr:hypothetical protein [Candidatus Obscuribacterales bacterium]
MSQIKDWYVLLNKVPDDEHLQWMSKTMSTSEFNRTKQSLETQLRDYSAGERALMDGITVLDKYLKLADDNHVVLFHLG